MNLSKFFIVVLTILSAPATSSNYSYNFLLYQKPILTVASIAPVIISILAFAIIEFFNFEIFHLVLMILISTLFRFESVRHASRFVSHLKL